MSKKIIISATILAITGFAMSALAAQDSVKVNVDAPVPSTAPASMEIKLVEGTEKCYSVAKPGMGMKEANGAEFLLLPTGVCDKLQNGSLVAPAVTMDMKAEVKK